MKWYKYIVDYYYYYADSGDNRHDSMSFTKRTQHAQAHSNDSHAFIPSNNIVVRFFSHFINRALICLQQWAKQKTHEFKLIYEIY